MGRSKGDKNIEQRVKNAIVYLKKLNLNTALSRYCTN